MGRRDVRVLGARSVRRASRRLAAVRAETRSLEGENRSRADRWQRLQRGKSSPGRRSGHTKRAVERMLGAGEFVCMERRGFQRIYDLAERGVPEALPRSS